MENIKMELRNIRNKILGEPKLEIGCEVEIKYDKRVLPVFYNKLSEHRDIVVLNIESGNVEYYDLSDVTILGKPVSINDLLLMLNIGNSHTLDLLFNGNGYSLQSRSSRNGTPIIDIKLDLTRCDIENQAPEVIKEIIRLIT